MNVKAFLLGLFRGTSMNGELQRIEEAARQDARLVVGTYLDSFEAEAARLLTDRQKQFLGYSEIEAEYTVQQPEPLTAADLKGLRKSELLDLASERGIDADESWTVKQLTAELTE